MPWLAPIGRPKTSRSRARSAGALDEPAAVADALAGDQDPLGVHAVEDVAEALALLPDEALAGISRSSKTSSLVTLLIITRRGLTVSPLPIACVQVDEEDGQAVGLALDLVARRRAREQDHRVGVLDARDVHLATVDT